MSGLSFKSEEDENEECKMVAELQADKVKETFTLAEVYEREKSLRLELNASNKELERLKAKLSALHFTFNGIYNDTLDPMSGKEKYDENAKKRLVAKADSFLNKSVMRELIHKEDDIGQPINQRKLTFFEKLKGLFNV